MKPMADFRFGSLDSVDEDRIFVVASLPSVEECKRFCDQQQANRNLVVIQDGVVRDCYKGLPDETNNAIYQTYHLHDNSGPLPVVEPVHRIVPLKALRAVRLVLSQASRSEYREIVKPVLASLNFARRKEALAQIDFAKLDLTAGTAKSIAFQLGQ